MKALLKKTAHAMSGLPVIGRFIQIGMAVFRLPEIRVACFDSIHRQHVLEAQQLPTLQQTFLDLNHRQHKLENEQFTTLQQTLLDLNHRHHLFETQQLPALLQNLSDLNHRQLSSDNDQDNLVKSVPIALRKISRDLVNIRGELENLSDSMEPPITETQEQLKELSNSMGRVNGDTQEQVKNESISMNQRITDIHDEVKTYSNSVDYLLGRVEFVRRELMYELRYGADIQFGKGEHLETKTKILSPEKLAAAKNERLRLNLGCGHFPLEGYINIDRRTLPGIDIVAEANDLPFDRSEVDEVFSSHLLEHFPQEQLRRELLPYIFNLLKTSGEFHAIVPDAETMSQEYANKRYPYDDFRESIYGAQDYEGDFHFNMFTPDSLSYLLCQAGFVNISIEYSGKRNGKCFEFRIKANRP